MDTKTKIDLDTKVLSKLIQEEMDRIDTTRMIGKRMEKGKKMERFLLEIREGREKETSREVIMTKK